MARDVLSRAIKPEPGRRAAMPSPTASQNTQLDVEHVRSMHSSTVVRDAVEASESDLSSSRCPSDLTDSLSKRHARQAMQRRAARSGAPSIDTRPPFGSTLGDNDHDDENPCILKEIKVASNSQSIQGSFIGPNIALKDFGHRLKAINDALGELQARGIQHVVDLPELVLVGDQSSGKSSLMSAIAGLTLPRSSGTCTRCPIHIRVSRADEWSCRVYLKRDYKYVPRDHPITKQDVTPRDKFPPWVPLDVEQRCEFKTVRDRFDSEEVETVLRCAQIAILNPSIPYQQFIPKLKGEVLETTRQFQLQQIGNHEINSEAQFSPNTVALEVKGPDLADLNFYDLPGVFMSAKREEDTFLERVVRNLACEYIARPNAIILWAVPMNQDADNSYAFSLIREQAAGDRCVGVMTKADLLPAESEASWLAMLNGQAHHTGLGYFITSRQGDDLDRQNAMEEAFFNRAENATGHWPLIFNRFRDRCGVAELKAFLSRKLGEQFSKVLPEINVKVRQRISQLEERLKLYPEPPPNPEMEIMRSLGEFSRGVKELVRAQSFQSKWDMDIMDQFKQKILGAKPKFNVSDHTRGRPAPASAPIIISLDDDPLPPRQSPQKRQVSNSERHGAPTKRQRVVTGSVKVEGSGSHEMFATPAPMYSAAPTRVRTKSLMEIRHLIRNNAMPGTHDLVSPEVYHPMYTEAARTWAPYLESFILRTFDFLQAETMKILDASFSHLMHTVVYRESKEHMKAFVDIHRDQLRAQLRHIYGLEAQRLFTKDRESLSRNKAAEKRVLSRHRHYFRWAAHLGEEPPTNIRKMDELTEEELAKESERIAKDAAKMQPDPFETEIEVASYVRGYYLTAASRFIDNVALHVMSGLFPQVAIVIDQYLHEKLGLASGVPDINLLHHLMSEGPDTERKRHDLKAEIAELEEAMQIIVDVEKGNNEHAGASEPSVSTQTMVDSPITTIPERGPSSTPYVQSSIGDA